MNRKFWDLSTHVDSASTRSNRWATTAHAFIYVVLINSALQLPFWVAERFYSFQRPLYNYDLAIALLGFCLASWLGWALLAVALTVDVVRIASLNYHFLNLTDFIDSARFLRLLNLGGFVNWGLIVMVGGVLLYLGVIAWGLRRWRRGLLVGQLFVLVALAGLDSMNGSMRLLDLGADRFKIPVNIAGSPIWNLYRMRAAPEDKAEATMTPMASQVFDSLSEWHSAHPNQSVMLVLVESMGALHSAPVRAWLTRQLVVDGVLSRWRLREGIEKFRGTTTHGELRVLCGKDGSYGMVDAALSSTCLPGQLNAAGFESIGYHGFQLSMFNRAHWWRTLQLKPYEFDYQRAASKDTDCHDVFHGICDGEVLRVAVQHVQESRRFSYVVTLDTHLPLPTTAGAIPADLRVLCDQQGLSTRACELVNQLGKTLGSLGGQLESGTGTPYVAVVGDHAPPFLDRESRAAFIQDKVPFLLLEPR